MPTFEITVETSFSAAHNLRSYRGGCEGLHGHNYKVRVTLARDALDEDGLVFDFKDLKKITREISDRLDHNYINEIEPFDALNPSAENLSWYFGEEIRRRMEDPRVRVVEVKVYETDSYCATYRPGRN